MAARNVFGRENRSVGVQSLDVILEGVVPTSEWSEIVNDLIKYLLYERGQIPMTYSQIKEFSKSESKKEICKDQCKKSSGNYQELFLQDINAMFATVTYVFANVVPIKKILIVFGASIISPRDSFTINFPTEFCDGTVLTHRTCMQKVFRQLIAKNFLDDAKIPSSCTSLFLLFWAPRNCNYQAANLLPKLHFNGPTRGIRYSINFSFTQVVTADPERLGNDSFDISGVEVLDSSLNEHVSSSAVSKANSYPTDTRCHSEYDENDDCVWFQAPTVVKGFKEKQ